MYILSQAYPGECFESLTTLLEVTYKVVVHLDATKFVLQLYIASQYELAHAPRGNL